MIRLGDEENEMRQRMTMNSKSLIIIGQVRGFTYPVYRYVRRATSFLHPVGRPYGEPLSDIMGYSLAENILFKYRHGYVLRSTANPAILLKFLGKYPELYNVLHIYRNPRQCIQSQVKLGMSPIEFEYIEEFSKFPTIHYSNLLYSPEVLWYALRQFGYEVKMFNYLTPRFREYRRKVIDRLCFA
jgi:hypothetical protein